MKVSHPLVTVKFDINLYNQLQDLELVRVGGITIEGILMNFNPLPRLYLIKIDLSTSSIILTTAFLKSISPHLYQ